MPAEMIRRRTARAAAAALAALALALGAVGCGDAREGALQTTGPASTSPAPAPAEVWFSDGDGVLRVERRPLAPGTDRLVGALAALAAGPLGPSLLPALPAGTRVLSATADGAVATVDLSAEFETGYPPGGAAAELAVVAPLVRTAADASGAPRVRVLVEGRTPVPTGSQLDFSQPFSPDDVPAPTGGG